MLWTQIPIKEEPLTFDGEPAIPTHCLLHCSSKMLLENLVITIDNLNSWFPKSRSVQRSGHRKKLKPSLSRAELKHFPVPIISRNQVFRSSVLRKPNWRSPYS